MFEAKRLARLFLTIVFFGLASIIFGCGGGGGGTAETVTQGPPPTAYTGQATLTWNAPNTNTDGTPLRDLAGYKVYYGTASGSYSSNVTVGNVTTYTVSNLPNGTYYFAVTAYDTAGFESAYSNEVIKTVQTTQQATPQPVPGQ